MSLTIKYCLRKNSEVTKEGECNSCIYYKYIEDSFGNNWFDCIFEFYLEMTKQEYLNLIDRLQIGL
jgi:hypothetical protein